VQQRCGFDFREWKTTTNKAKFPHMLAKATKRTSIHLKKRHHSFNDSFYFLDRPMQHMKMENSLLNSVSGWQIEGFPLMVCCSLTYGETDRERHLLQILTNRRHISAGTKGYFLSLRSFQHMLAKATKRMSIHLKKRHHSFNDSFYFLDRPMQHMKMENSLLNNLL
jgi:hypothetical protein